MRVLGYGFREEVTARRARDELSERYRLGPQDSSVAQLADEGVVLAVRISDDTLAGVTQILAAHGGVPLTNVDENWTQLRRLKS